MYDSIPVDDMDFEDIEWQKWLQGLVNTGIYHVHACSSIMDDVQVQYVKCIYLL